ncbi:DedA family protein [Bacillus amyloliquefaciens]|uniref:DedA family protein n=1 Tax=Bacillus amyloliquefaciens TaxID=1390 RepID=UPI00336B1827
MKNPEAFMSHFITLFEQHSYLILFSGIILELLAIPISAEMIMSYAGYFVYQGKMDYALALLTAFISAGTGITITYWVGRTGGYRLIERYGKYVHLGPERYNKTAAWFERSGSKLLVFAYFIPGVRHLTGYVSGSSRMSFPTFNIPAYIGAILWGSCFITLGKVLGPKWETLHQAASKYAVIFLFVFAVLLAGYLLFRFYKIQIRNFFIHWLMRLTNRFRTIRATEIFLTCLTLVLIGFVILMFSLAQDYLANDVAQFNQIAEYVVYTAVYTDWMKGFLIFQQPAAIAGLIVLTIIRIWLTNQNRLLEYLLFAVSILGGVPFRAFIMEAFSILQTFGFKGTFHSDDFPDLNAAMMIIIYGTCIFLLVRHSNTHYVTIAAPLFGLLLFIGLAIVNIKWTSVLPSDIVGGYVYGGVWMFFNFLLFELFRLVLERIK